MARVRAKRGGSVLCAIDVPKDAVSAYGVFDVEIVPDAVNPDVLKVVGMVEKPAVEDAPSTFAAAGRYLLDRAIFDALRRIEPGAGGELQLTDAIALLISEGIRFTWWCTAERVMTWATPAGTSALRWTWRSTVTITARPCVSGSRIGSTAERVATVVDRPITQYQCACPFSAARHHELTDITEFPDTGGRGPDAVG